MTPDKLKTNTRKELAALAKRHCVAGWHGMRKEELIEALLDVEQSKIARQAPTVGSVARVTSERRDPRPAPPAEGNAGQRRNGFSASSRSRSSRRRPKPSARAGCPAPRRVRRDISTAGSNESVHEEIVATAQDPYWIHVQWVLKRSTVLRAEAALGSDWFRAVPVVRVFAMRSDDVNGTSSDWLRDVEIHGECDHWFVPVENPPGAYRMEVGYLTPAGRFFALAKSRKVTTPRPGSQAAERLGLQRPVAGRVSNSDPEFEKFLAARATAYAAPHLETIADEAGEGSSGFQLEAELVVSGTSQPDCQLTIQGQTVKVNKNGQFSTRVSLGNGRQVIPATYISPDGTEKRTIVLAVERNTRQKGTRRNSTR